ncbi:probable glucan 1,3-beta-glucosidase A isoform X3 [Malania oleifera]|uniref:probable glucan 1,3-beta-glucosidase A isoform X3 n=1 Tax=Malania oleifera TaxID=397392 RepID=UPI0025ADFA05|nr:probable glucan 1,3-beta-glucosidase A isoform X3 [Malania oleifera]
MELVFCKWVCAFLMSCWLIFSTAHSVVGLHGYSKVRAVNLGGWLVVEGWIKPSLFDDIPNGDMLDGTEVQLKSVTLQKYVCAENGGGTNVTADRDVPLSWETFRLWRVSDSQFQFRTSQGQFLTYDGEGGYVSASAGSPSATETFYIERNNNGRVHVKLKSGTYLQRHRNSFITVDDFEFLHKHGINAVRIPVGWWIAFDPSPRAPFIGGSLTALDNAFSWAQAYNIKCIIDLHAAPGSQNGMEHSASRDGSTDWSTSSDYISKTLDVIDFLASRYADHPALLGIELLNEPSAATVPLDILVSYYKQGYEIVRKHSPTAYVIICQRIGNADPSELYQANVGSYNIVVDLHYYNLFDNFFINMNSTDNIEFIFKSRQAQLRALNSANGPLLFIGEWVNEWNVTYGSQIDYQDFGRAQLEVYDEASFGWAYWTLKNDRKHWDFEWNIQNNYLQLGKMPKRQIFSNLLLLGLACSCFCLLRIF